MSKKAYMNAQQKAADAVLKGGGDNVPHMSDGFYSDNHGILSADIVMNAIKTHFGQQMKNTLASIWGDKLFCAFLALSVGGFGYIGLREFIKLQQYYRRLRLEKEARDRALSRYKEQEAQRIATEAANNNNTTSNDADLLPDGADIEAQAATAATTTTKDSNNKKKSNTSHRRRGGLWGKLRRLISIAVPNATCYTAQILIAQFCLLVTRTFLSINCAKNSILAITKAISGASWQWWVRWLTNFSMWMLGGIVVNSGLRFGEQLLSLQIRSALTQHIHKNYFRGINYYRVNSAPSNNNTATTEEEKKQTAATTTTNSTSSATAQQQPAQQLNKSQSPISQAFSTHVSGIENRIVRDVANFSDNIANLYGHSFKPILEFVLSLTEASTDLGFARPLALFAVSILINLSMRSISPHLGRMISTESENEGQLQQAHTRIASHVEEIAFMQGGRTEEILIHDKLQQLLYTKIKHNIARVRKSVADNIVKFSGLLVGGIFVHIPFLLSTQHTAEQRIAGFRGTEEVMLRCGSAFSEILLLGKELQEVGGHCDRILDVFDALDACDKNTNQPTAAGSNTGGEGGLESDILVYTSDGCSVRRKRDVIASSQQVNADGTLRTSTSTGSLGGSGLRRTLSGMLIDNSLDSIQMKKITVVPPEDHNAYVNWYLSAQEQRQAGKPENEIVPFTGRCLISNLTLNIPQGKSVLITGPNGSGKTSLFRCLAGLWPIASGYLYRPSGGVMMVPQNPYLIYGTLRDNVTYPILYRLFDGSKESDAQAALYGNGDEGQLKKQTWLQQLTNSLMDLTKPNDNDTTATTITNNHIVYLTEQEMDDVDQRVHKAMELACGAKIIQQQTEGLYTICQWDGKLSGGERQKVGLARVFYHKPNYALLDEATSAVHPKDEALMYSNVTQQGITVFSIAHRPALRAYHQIELIYLADGLGGYQVQEPPAAATH